MLGRWRVRRCVFTIISIITFVAFIVLQTISEISGRHMGVQDKLRPEEVLSPLNSTVVALASKSVTKQSTVLLNSEINPHNFNFTLNQPSICRSDRRDVFLVAVVHSAPQNIKRRMVVRETWASQQFYDKVKTVTIFAMGQAVDPKLQTAIEKESQLYGDIIQEDFIDSYKNLTYKGIMWLRWVSTYCPDALYTLKVDDDIFVNIFNLVAHISTVYKRNVARDRTVMCLVWSHMQVQRNPKSKWYVSPNDWAPEHFPKYCSGSAYILTRDLIKPMFEQSKRTKFFWVDDFYVTGLLPSALNVSYVSLASLYVLKKRELHSKLVDGYAIFGHIPGSMNQRYSLWHEVLEARGLTSIPKS